MASSRKQKTVVPMTAKALREILRERGIADSISDFARKTLKTDGTPYRRESIYTALAHPHVCPLLYRKILAALK